VGRGVIGDKACRDQECEYGFHLVGILGRQSKRINHAMIPGVTGSATRFLVGVHALACWGMARFLGTS
jgi:hypothetical protein